jgi:zinc transporter 1/2/3
MNISLPFFILNLLVKNYWSTSILKIIAMVLMFLMILIFGNIPLRSVAFHENKKLLSLSASFSGGLFLSVGMIHLLP